MKKLLSLMLAMVMLISLCAGCANTDDKADEKNNVEQINTDTVRLGGLKGPTSMGMVKLLDDNEKGNTEIKYDFTMAATADELTGKIINGTLDILALPANVASVLYNKSQGEVQILAVNMIGGIFIVQKGEKTINGISDLKGKTIYASGKGATPEYALTYLLSQNGIRLESDVSIKWLDEPTEIVAKMQEEENSVAMLPQPFVTVATTQLENLNKVISIGEEWEKSGNSLVNAGIIVRREFAEQNPETVKKFLSEYKNSTSFVKENISEASTLIEKYGIVKAQIAKKALSDCDICCYTGEEMKNMVSGYLEILSGINSKAVGGNLPGDDFYYVN